MKDPVSKGWALPRGAGGGARFCQPGCGRAAPCRVTLRRAVPALAPPLSAAAVAAFCRRWGQALSSALSNASPVPARSAGAASPRGEARPQQGWGTLQGSAPTTSNPLEPLQSPRKGWPGFGAAPELGSVVSGLCTWRDRLGKLPLGGRPFGSVRSCSKFLFIRGPGVMCRQRGGGGVSGGHLKGLSLVVGLGTAQELPAAPGAFFVAAKPGEADANSPKKKKKPASRVSAVLSPN